MDIALVVFCLYAGVNILYVLHSGLYLVSTNFYDIWQQRRKGKRSFRLPVKSASECGLTASFLFYVMDPVQLTVPLSCIARSRGQFRPPGNSTWTSPQPASSVVVVARAAA